MNRIIIAFLILITFCANGQKSWSLEECINYAIENNLHIKMQDLNVKNAESDLTQSYAATLPGINGYASHSYNYGITIDRYTNDWAKTRVQSNNFYLSGQLNIFSGLQTINTIRKNRIDLAASRYDSDRMRNDISLNIANAYLEILYNDEIVKTAGEQLETIKQQAERTKKLFEAGSIAKSELLAIEAQAAADELLLVNAHNSLDLSYLNLKQMLDLPGKETFAIQKPVITITGEDLLKATPEQIYETALGNQPDIKSSELKLESSNRALAIARGLRSPTINLQGSIGTGYSGAGKRIIGYDTTIAIIGMTNEAIPVDVITPYPVPIEEKTPFGTQLDDNVNKTVGISMNIPIFNGLQVYNNIARSKIAIKNAEYNLQLSKNNLSKNIQQAYADAKAAFNKYNATKKSLEAIGESYKYAKEKFEVGMLNFVDFNDAKTKFSKAQSDLAQAKYDYMFRIKVLDFYMGKSLY